jgi:hypothetical protein
VRDGGGGAPARAGLRPAATEQHGGDGDDCAGDRRGCGSTAVLGAAWLHDGRGGQRGGGLHGGRGAAGVAAAGGTAAQLGGRHGHGGGRQYGNDGGARGEDGK